MNYQIRLFRRSDIEAIVRLFNQACEHELAYKPWSEDYFIEKFINNPHFSDELTLVATDEADQIIGFIHGLVKKVFLPNEDPTKSPGFITMVLVEASHRRNGIARELLKQIEEKLYSLGKKRIDCSFFNPLNLEWIVPNTTHHLHPNAPGVMVPSSGYEFFLKQGYKAVAKQNSYYINLTEFNLPDTIKAKLEELKRQDIVIEFFDQKKHSGFEELFDLLGNEGWRHEIMNAAYGDNPRPVLIPSYKGKIIGFTGPLGVQESGRGYFAGIGIHPEFRSYGAGKSLFFMLCEELKTLGAHYMTLFTGEENPARRMYEAAGFEIVKSWQVMRKEV
jgi:ribosomal protein S18 acetylase RimI-like enzyme